MKNNKLYNTMVFVMLTACSGGVDDALKFDDPSAAGGGNPPGPTPGPTCEAPRCYESATSAYPLEVQSNSLNHAIDAHATLHVAGKFTSSNGHTVMAVTSGANAPAARARATPTTGDGPALVGRATGPGGRPLRLTNPANGPLVIAKSGPNTMVIDRNGDLFRNAVRIGQRGLPGTNGTDGEAGDDGEDGEDGLPGRSAITFLCGTYSSCAAACPNVVVGEAVGQCEVALLEGGCSFGGTNGRCCACSPS